jgi:putative ABC transport system substrate-binding protein
MIRRREFIAGLCGTAAWPVVARAQQAAIPVIGILQAGAIVRSLSNSSGGFFQGLSEMGYLEGLFAPA